MPATSREQNVARLEHQTNTVWQKTFDVILRNSQTFHVALQDSENVSEDTCFSREHPFAALLLDLATARLIEEAVRRGIIPEQEIEP